jgi:cation transport ATPase
VIQQAVVEAYREPMSDSRVDQVHVVALVVTLLISGGYLLVPTYASGQTVVAVNGWWVGLLLVVPVAIVSWPLMDRGARRAISMWSSALLLTAFALVTGFTIGTPYLLPAALLLVAALRGHRDQPARGRSSSAS